ncbi:diguanylate cyclase (GGDEF) domain-containing protein [Nitrosomonas aestuarii]|uniref:diguanylate cyclase n=1 Tax=Nitrosomonas aestuarii TaxID=52441 RepID=A0A1I4F4K8_9PROT|nr:GGDEF domain-containing protein [Nitrosomonas aestuarii]SFL12864.1 diguanylate cyclase (GGDEF) domain-containing protein [Nitrosomonas aestuarii]
MNNFLDHQFQQQNPRFLSRLFYAQTASMVLAGSIAIITLGGWLFPSIGALLPADWWLMKQNAALCILISAIAIILIRKNSNILIIRLCGLIVIILSTASLYGHTTGQSLPIETFLTTDNYAKFSGRITVHGAVFFCLLGFSFIVAKTDQKHRNNIRDIFTLLLIGMVLVIFSGYFFSATSLYGHSTETLVSFQTFFCMCLLTFANFVRGIQGGIFSLFLGLGIASYTARVTLPWTLIGPFAVISAINYFSTTQEIRIALSATLLSLIFFFIILWLANRISYLENDLRKLALTDEMTGLYNHRAFCILGKQSFLESLRNDSVLILLYFDLDGLKKINDSLGHQIGSEMIIEFADLLKANFRRYETIARVGGDEFVVLSKQNQTDAALDTALKRLADAVDAANSKSNKPYKISYSEGKITGRAKDFPSLDDLLTKADALMYENKRKKKLKY